MTDFKLTASQIAEIIHGVTSCLPRLDGSKPKPWNECSHHDKYFAAEAVKEIYSYDEPKTPEELHNLWMRPKVQHGWTYGELYDEENKKHPCILPFAHLTPSEILKDVTWATLTQMLKPYYTIYDKEMPDFGDVFSVEEFVDNCRRGLFTDYDGYGNPVKDNVLADIEIYPSELNKIPSDATQIVWYNR
jgi:hypothetical protein